MEWSAEMEAAFTASKKTLAFATYLAHPLPGAVLNLSVDASATHIGAGFHQHRPGSIHWEPLGFFYKKLELAQTKYSTFDRDLLGWLALWGSVISVICWKGGGLPYLPTTNPSPTPSADSQSRGLPGRPAIFHRWLNILQTFSMLLVSTTSLQTPSPGRLVLFHRPRQRPLSRRPLGLRLPP